ncbi:MAG: hypothetical protein ABIB55_02510 [Candidatus Nealsonbacteria bacterium]
MNNRGIVRRSVAIYGKTYEITVNQEFLEKLAQLPEKQRKIIELRLNLKNDGEITWRVILTKLGIEMNNSARINARQDFEAGLWKIIYLLNFRTNPKSELDAQLLAAIEKVEKNYYKESMIINNKFIERMVAKIKEALMENHISNIRDLEQLIENGLPPSSMKGVGKSSLVFLKKVIRTAK